MRNYYFDMDGVYVLYDKNAYIGPDPLYLRKNAHYFLNCKPDPKMLELVDRMHTECKYTGDDLYFLTAVDMHGSIFNEHLHDKIMYIQKWAPYIDINHILISVTSKRDTVEYIKNHQITKNDILIDDYNVNLNDWKFAGGTSIKYCNGINNPNSFDGLRLRQTESVYDMMSMLQSIEKE